MKTIKIVGLSSLMGIFILLNNCGGSGSSEAATQIVAIDAACNNINDMTTYTPLQSGDIITKKEDNTVINIFSNQNYDKVACVASGSAVIIRSI